MMMKGTGAQQKYIPIERTSEVTEIGEFVLQIAFQVMYLNPIIALGELPLRESKVTGFLHFVFNTWTFRIQQCLDRSSNYRSHSGRNVNWHSSISTKNHSMDKKFIKSKTFS